MSKKPKARSKKTGLSDDETVLWQRVTESITPIEALERDRGRVRVTGAETSAPEESPSARAPVSPAKPARVNTSKSNPGSAPIPQRLTQAPVPKGLGQTDVRKLRSGRINIEARLDLHGLRQGEAHAALRHFLFSSQQRGLRWVIVITGKGGRSTRSGDSDNYFDGLGGTAEPGVLRRNVPLWLQEPDLRSIVIGFQTAGPQHGGEGALYINLRRRDRVK